MKIGITGASGFIGTPLVASLRQQGHDVVRFVRGRADAADERGWDPASRRLDPQAVADLGAIIHLAGAGVADKRWTPSYKKTILDSRVDGTIAVATAMAAARAAVTPGAVTRGPGVLLSASGVNWYGDTGDRVTDESGPTGQGFLAEVCRQWEASTAPAEDAGIRVAHLRTGIVLSGSGGALAKQLPIFRLGVGAPLGSGRQWNSWISLRDEIAAITHLLTADVAGPVNLVGPAPVTNRAFTSALGRALHRPTLPVPVPGFALKAALGELAAEAVLVGQRLLPQALQRSGFDFADTEVAGALRSSI